MGIRCFWGIISLAITWFRFYSEALNDPKVQELDPEMFRYWVNILCIASDNHERGVLPETFHVAFHLRITVEKATEILQKLEDHGLLGRHEGKLSPHNWSRRQFQSDDAYERVKRFRSEKRNVSPLLSVSVSYKKDNKGVKGEKKKTWKLTEEFIGRMFSKYGDVFTEPDIRETIALALDHQSAKKYANPERYIDMTWLGRNAKERRNGQHQGNSTGQAPKSSRAGTLEQWQQYEQSIKDNHPS